jgi:hypothetical protein
MIFIGVSPLSPGLDEDFREKVFWNLSAEALRAAVYGP